MSQFRSPFKTTQHSLPNFKNSISKHKTKSNHYSQSKYQPSAKISKGISQAYTNVFNRLQRINKLGQFVRQVSKFVLLTEVWVETFVANDKETQQSRKEVPEIGKMLLVDGSFLVHYCKLLEHFYLDQAHVIKKSFYNIYKQKIEQRNAFFTAYFRKEIAEDQRQKREAFINKSKSPIKSKSNSKKSSKKATSQYKVKVNQIDKFLQSASAFDQNSVSHITTVSQIYSRKKRDQHCGQTNKQKVHQRSFVKEQDEEEYYSLYSPIRHYKPKQPQEEKEILIDITQVSKSQRKAVTFQDQLKSNKKLQEIYEKVLKERAEIISHRKSSFKKQPEPVIQQPLVRSSFKRRMIQAEMARVKPIEQTEREKFDDVTQQMLKLYPSITRNGKQQSVDMGESIILGVYKNYVIKKAMVTDIQHYLQPIYLALVLQSVDKTKENVSKIEKFVYKEDKTLEVILIN